MFNRIRKALTARKTKRQVRPLPKQLQAPELPLVMHDNHDGTFTIAPNRFKWCIEMLQKHSNVAFNS